MPPACTLKSAQYRLAQARGLRLPTLGLQISRQRAYSDTPAAATRDSRSLQTGATLNGSQPLFNRTNDVTIAQTEKGVDISTAEFDIADQDLILRVAQAYFDVLTAQDTLASARGNLAAIAEQVASAKRNFEVGTATITDTREAQARFDLARATQIVAENDLLTRRIALDTLVGRSNVTPNPLAVPVAVPAIAPTNTPPSMARRSSPGFPTAGRSASRATTSRPTWAFWSTCPCLPATRSKTGSRKHWCLKQSRKTIWRHSGAASHRAPEPRSTA